MSEKNIKLRISVIFGIFIFIYLLIFSKLFHWQIVKAEELKTLSENQSSEELLIEARRGEILASDGFPLATSKISYLLYANPKLAQDKGKYAELIAKALHMDSATVSAQLSKDLFWVKIKERLTPQEKTKIETFGFPGVGFQEQIERYYPEASTAAHLVGFLGKNIKAEAQGFFGLEGFYDSQMKGRDGRLYVIKDALSNPVVNDIREERAINGRSIKLTIDRTIQYFAEKRLKEGVMKYEAEGGSVIVMDTKTGKILASASVPDFDPTNYYDFAQTSYKDPTISDLYEPGSTFKVLIMAAALDLKKVTPETKCTICDGPVEVSGYTIKTWNSKYYPNSTMKDVLQHSDNTGMVFIGQKTGPTGVREYLKRFGIGEKTGIDLQGEVTGEIRDTWSEIDLATITFGQGISITPLQLANGVNAIANNGVLMRPYIVENITTDDGKTITVKPQEKRRVIKESTAKVMSWMMVNNVEAGESHWTKIKDYKIAGKTGTAQVPVAGHYDPNVTIASFVGFFPAEDPKVTILVLVNKPKTSIYGSETAAPIFFSVAKDIIQHLGISPSY